MARFVERATKRDPQLESNLFDLYQKDLKDYSMAQFMIDPDNFKHSSENDTRPMREYIIKESIEQYKDYYETDGEEQAFFEYLDNISNRDKIRFGEIFEDYTVDKNDHKDYVMI